MDLHEHPVEEGVITDAKKRYSAGVLKYKQMGYWDADCVPKATDLIAMFRITPQEGIDSEECAAAVVTAFDSAQGVESLRMSYLVNRPKSEPGFRLARQEVAGRQVQYTVHSYATDKPEAERYCTRQAALP